MTSWTGYRDRLLANEPGRVVVIRAERIAVADIGSVVFKRIDHIVAEAQATLRSE